MEQHLNVTFIRNEPIGEDFFAGKSHENLAQSISNHIIEMDKLENRPYLFNIQQIYQVDWRMLLNYFSQFVYDEKSISDKISANPNQFLSQSILQNVLAIDCKLTDWLVLNTLEFFKNHKPSQGICKGFA